MNVRMTMTGLCFAALAMAPEAAVHAAEPDERIQTLVVYGSDPCPKADDGSIIVCARKPESERYRIPKSLRDKAVRPGEQAWGTRVQTLEAASRAVLPNSCSPIGSNGYTGCTAAMLREWYAERQRLAAQAQPEQ